MGKSIGWRRGAFQCAHAKGMPMIVTASNTAVIRWPSASHQPASTSQMMLPMSPNGPVPRSWRLEYSARETAFRPNGNNVYEAMLKAARESGRAVLADQLHLSV